MSRVDELQKRHDSIIAEIEGLVRAGFRSEEQESLIALINKYGNTCIKLVEAEYEEVKGYGGTD